MPQTIARARDHAFRSSSYFDLLRFTAPETGIQIHDGVSALTVAQLLFLEAEEATRPIHLYINSPGGSVTAGMGIYDTV